MEKSPQISEAEYEIMKIIWSDSPISTNEVGIVVFAAVRF